ncbi:endocuticle structural glycoprotein ABD-4-like [Athalia rosae]|uniref:endocuticle structural glycoprotein ABD-4-like n=1 Tax=Athalia rosae TaxID=37344 RepID=UPI002033D80F|nr:endocuticle structural glycoprotein ABD-4-like [Athalia rosae]
MNAVVISFFAVLAVAAGAPASPLAPAEPKKPEVEIISQQSEINADGTYVNKFATSNGISVSEEGSLKVGEKPDEVYQVAKGTSEYSAPDGTLIQTVWYADETGFHASGPHIPVAPETPDYIKKSLDWSAAHPYEEEQESAKKV